MSDEQQSEAELAAHFGPDGPVAAASDWLRAIVEDRDYPTAWALMSPTLRTARAQAWLWNNREFFERAAETLDEQAAMLAAVSSEHPYWDEFAEIELGSFAEALPADDYADIGISSRPRPMAPGVELVLFIRMADAEAMEGVTPVEGGGVLLSNPPEGGVPVQTFAQILVEHDGERWLVAGHNGDTIPQLGWPPVI